MAQFEINWKRNCLGTIAYSIYQDAIGQGSELDLKSSEFISVLEQTQSLQLNPAQIVEELIKHDIQVDSELAKKLDKEITIRGKLMMEQWQTRGPGLVFALINLLPELFAIEPAALSLDVLPVVPQEDKPVGWLGDGSTAVVTALMYDPNPELPELMRVTNLWARNTARAKLSLSLENQFLICCAAILVAADHVDLIDFDSGKLNTVVEFWCDGIPYDAERLSELCQLMESSPDVEQFKPRLLNWIRDRNGFKELPST